MAEVAASRNVVFVLDCDNTLLDNDTIKTDLGQRLHALLGDDLSAQFWRLYEEVREQTGTVDYPLTLTRLAALAHDEAVVERARKTIMDYPFAERLYPASLDTLRYLNTLGMPVIVSDGDMVYQPRKIAESGLAAAVAGHVVIYVHKEEHLDEILARWPAKFYVMIDDKARILAEIKRRLPSRFVTVHVRQGHYGTEQSAYDVAPDITVDTIGDVARLSLADLAPHLAPQPTTPE